jgi:hypothetical protein
MKLELDWFCPVCGDRVTRLVRVGDFLFGEPCAHRITDLRQLDWYQSRDVGANRKRGPYRTRQSRH